MDISDYGKSLAFASLILHRSDGAGLVKDWRLDPVVLEKKSNVPNTVEFAGLRIYIDDATKPMAAARDISGIGISRDPGTIPVGLAGPTQVVIPGEPEFTAVKISKLFAREHYFFDWIMQGISQNDAIRQDIKIEFGPSYNIGSTQKMNYRYILRNAFPVELSIPTIKQKYVAAAKLALLDELGVVESLTLRYSLLEIEEI